MAKLLLLLSQIFLFTTLNPASPSAADTFWKLDNAATRLTQSAVDISLELDKTGVIPPKLEERIRSLVYDFYTLRKQFVALSDRYQRRQLEAFRLPSEPEDDSKTIISNAHLLSHEYFEILMGCLTDTLVYETLRALTLVMDRNKVLQKKLEEIEVNGETAHYSRLSGEWLSRKGRVRFAKSLLALEANHSVAEHLIANGWVYLAQLLRRIDTPLAEATKNSASFWGQLAQAFSEFLFAVKIRKGKWLNWTEYQLSRVFGNVAGSINVQKLLPSIPVSELDKLHSQVLQPGDIIVEKTAGAITDTIIPGHFGHVAMVLGTVEQLQTVLDEDGRSVLQSPEFLEILPKLQSGHTVIEAIRPGIRLVDIREWKITDIAVLRPKTQVNLGRTLKRSLKYLNTNYDFAFDVNTSAIVVCSELPFHTYTHLRFRTHAQMGRHTISPDDIAIMAGSDPRRPFELISFHHKTQAIEPSLAEALYIRLVDKDSNYHQFPEQR